MSLSEVGAKSVVAELMRDRPNFHDISSGDPVSYHINRRVLDWISTHITPGSATLETGAGYTTVLFCSLGGIHTAVAPAATEFEAIRGYCASKNIATSGLDARVDISQTALPRLVDGPPLDMVLIDGDHAFPAPFIDFYYTADRLKQGGWLLVDDVQLETGHVLREFLIAEPEWEHVEDLGKTSVFRRLTSDPLTTKWWGEQPWSSRIHLIEGDRMDQRLRVLRNRARLRSRARSALRRILG